MGKNKSSSMSESGGGQEEVFTSAKRRRLDRDFEDLPHSQLEEEQFLIVWTLFGYPQMKNNFTEIKSPEATGGPKNKHTWQFILRPTRIAEQREYLSVRLILTGFGDEKKEKSEKLGFQYELSLVDKNGRPNSIWGNPSISAKEFEKNPEFGWAQFLLAEDVDRYLVNETLTFQCVVTVRPGSPRRLFLKEAKVENSLPLNLKMMFTQSESKDVFITVDNGAPPLKAHKEVLILRSSVFAKMFGTQTPESQINEVAIKEYDSEVVSGMLEWIYTGSTGLLLKRAPCLLQLANQYDLQGLKEDCEKLLGDYLSVENVSRILVLAHLHQAPGLKEQAMKLMRSNKKMIVKTSGFEEMAKKYARTGIFMELLIDEWEHAE